MKPDKPWRPNDYPAPQLYIVPPSGDKLRDPDLSEEQADRIDKILVIAFGIAMGLVGAFVLVMFATHALAPPGR